MDSKTKILSEMLESDLSVSLVYMREGKIYPLHGRGVGPLLNLYEAFGKIDDLYIADKVVGRAAAYLIEALGAKAVYAHLLCEPARMYLKSKGIAVSYRHLAPYISNRTGDGLCPFEKCLEGIEEGEEAISAIKKKAAELFGERK